MILGEEPHLLVLAIPMRSMPVGYAWWKSQDWKYLYRTGIALAQRMLQNRPGLSILLCTGYSNLFDETKAQTRGIKGFG